MPAAYRRTRTYLITAFVVFLVSSVICMLIRPDLFDHPHYGLSFFGSIRLTLVPYVIGLLIPIYCLWKVAQELKPYKHAWMLRLGFLFGAGCLLGILLTPMALHPVVWWTHMGISLVLLVSQVTVCTWVLLQKNATAVDYLIGAVFFVSGITMFLWDAGGGVAITEILVFATNLLILGRAALRFTSQKTD